MSILDRIRGLGARRLTWRSSTTVSMPAGMGVAVRPPRTARFKRSVLKAILAARRAVKSNLPEVEHLAHRLSEYWRVRPRVSHPLPEMQISPAAELELILPVDPRHPIDRVLDQEGDLGDIELSRDPGAADAQRALREGADRAALLGKELAELETQDREIERHMSETTEKLDTVARDRENAMDAGTKKLEAGVAAPAATTPPSVPSAMRTFVYRIGQWFLLITEGIFIFIPLANTQGVDPTALDAEFARNPTGVLFAAIPALLLAGVTFITLQWAAAGTKKILEAKEPDPKRAFRIAGIGAAAFLAVSLLWVTSSMRAQFSASATGFTSALEGAVSRPSTSTVSYFLMALAAVVGAVILHATADRAAELRAEALQRAATPTTEQAVAARRVRQLSEYEEMIASLQQRREINNARIAMLSEQEQSVRRALRELARSEQHAVDMFVDDVCAAISTDKYYFRLQARRWKRDHLLAPPAPSFGELSEDTVVHMAQARRTK